jgi:hypothetical protein
MKRLVFVSVVAMFVSAPLAWAAPGGQSGPPPHGCDQADEVGVGGAYHSTCDGSPSMNGNGDGAATGKPCAGCVGAADNKNPPGQAPDGSDSNNGYECDGNSGIGKTNPAHTGCVREPYSGADAGISDDDRGRGANGKKTRLTGYLDDRPSGPRGDALGLAALGLAAVYAASRLVRRLARR